MAALEAMEPQYRHLNDVDGGNTRYKTDGIHSGHMDDSACNGGVGNTAVGLQKKLLWARLIIWSKEAFS